MPQEPVQSFWIRDMRQEEKELVRELTLTAYSEYATIMTSSAWAGLHRALLDALELEVEAEIIVAEQQETSRLLGSVMLFPARVESYGSKNASSNIPELRLLAVLPQARKQGVGQALVEACIQRAQLQGATALGLHTSDSMVGAIALYTRRGFVRVPKRDFQPIGAELVKAYQLDLSQNDGVS